MSSRQKFLKDRGDAAIFVNRELSFLSFNQRVLEEVSDSQMPLLERLRFASIVSTNLDEFFMIRVAGLKQQVKSGVLDAGPDGMLATEQLQVVRAKVSEQVQALELILVSDILPSLRAEGIAILSVDELMGESRANLGAYFEQSIFPMLTPLAVDPGHPFPFLKNRSLDLAVHLLPERSVLDASPLLAVIQVPSLLPRFVPVEETGYDVAFVRIEDLVRSYVHLLFPGMRIIEVVAFRVIRNWDLSFDVEEQEDLLEAVQKELRRRWRLDAVRLEIENGVSKVLEDRLRQALELDSEDVQRCKGWLALADTARLLEVIGRSDLRDEPFEPVLSSSFAEEEDVFAAVARGDVLLHHPYESYEPVLDLLASAASDAGVLAVKQTLYRMNPGSPILDSLIRAAENGKQVTALVELKARFHEEMNVEWARALEQAGVHVVYGIIGLKTHCKITLVVRRETGGIRRYVHLGTGNYNEQTAKTYSDLSFFTARDDVGRDIAALFNLLTGYSEVPSWEKLVVAPLGLRQRLLELIDGTRQVASEGRPAKIVMKTNALNDIVLSKALVSAAQAGVEVVLLVRGPCTLRTGIRGKGDRIRVQMIVDRFLEHSRLLYFARDGDESVFVTSTDIVHRNFDRRVEVMLPIEDESIKRRIVDEILATELSDDTKTAILQPNGQYLKSSEGTIRAQERFMKLAHARASMVKKPRAGFRRSS
ncbi:MAG: polyphosphate kinase 1 [Myxococcales bacterium]|nr:polyphosphate kinase 1 [Myxococcales bacterium]